MKRLHEGLIWGEGLRWHDGRFWLSDTQGKALWSGAAGGWTSRPMQPASNGLWVLPDGRLAGALMADRRIGVWTGTGWQTHADLAELAPGPLGDMTGDADGNLYVDDVGFNAAAGEAPKPGRILFVAADGRARVAAEDVHFPNGIALIHGGRTLVLAETFRQRLLAFDVDAHGELSGRRVLADLAAEIGPVARPDGICATLEEDGVWVATLDGHAVVRVRDGLADRALDCGSGFPIACCLDARGGVVATLAETDGLDLMAALKAGTVRTAVVSFPPG